jgi:hypothetical protein
MTLIALEALRKPPRPGPGPDLLATRDDFPLPVLAPAIAERMEALQNGRSFINVKGIPVSHNAAGDILGHVRETAADPSDTWSVSGSQHMTSGRMAMPLFKWVQQGSAGYPDKNGCRLRHRRHCPSR